MKLHHQISIIIIFLIKFSPEVYAQQVPATQYLLPDGRSITEDKIDSLKKAWNVERILFQHNKEDDKNHVMHLIKMTPEMASILAEIEKKAKDQ